MENDVIDKNVDWVGDSGLKVISEQKQESGAQVLRFGERQHLQEMVETGPP